MNRFFFFSPKIDFLGGYNKMGQLTKRLAPLQFPWTKIYDRRKISPTIFLKKGGLAIVYYINLYVQTEL